jgi:hypothetical protein
VTYNAPQAGPDHRTSRVPRSDTPREMLTQRNFASGNAGFIFYYDIAAPLLVIALFVAT